MKIVIPGGSGQIGTISARSFHEKGHQVTILSRTPSHSPWRTVYWNAETLGPWTEELEGTDAVINLTGRSVNCRYNAENRRLITESRVKSTQLIGEAIAHASTPPRVWLQSGTSTIYTHRYDAPNDETHGLLGCGTTPEPDTWHFSLEVARAWEKALNETHTPLTRKIILRSSMTMSPDPGGVFRTLLALVKVGLGGSSGNGRQFVSWIHDQDFIRAIEWLIEREDLAGPVNLTAPTPLPNADFMRILRKAWGIKIGLPATKWMVEIGTFFLRTESELILKSRRVIPKRLLDSGFTFQFPLWETAARDLCERSR